MDFSVAAFRPGVTGTALVTTLLVAGLVGTIYLYLAGCWRAPNDFTPAAALDHAMKADVTGPVLNDYDFGGYLIFRGVPTFFDGRTLPFGKQFALDYFDAFAVGAGDKLDGSPTHIRCHGLCWGLGRPQRSISIPWAGSVFTQMTCRPRSPLGTSNLIVGEANCALPPKPLHIHNSQ
jgi:hypothetical protein